MASLLTACQQTPSLVHPVDDKQGLKHQCTSFLSFFLSWPIVDPFVLSFLPICLCFVFPRPLPYFIIVFAVAGCPISISVVLRHHRHESWMDALLQTGAVSRKAPLLQTTYMDLIRELKANCTKGDFVWLLAARESKGHR